MSNNGRKIEEEYKVLAETSPDCIKLIDTNGDLLYINPAGLKEHGLSSLKEAISKKWRIVDDIITEDVEIFENAFERAKKGESSTIEIRHNKNSSRNVCLETMAPVKNSSGDVIAIFGVSRDITNIKETQEELRKSREELKFIVEERTKELKKKIAELERINEVMTGRELRMIELKDEIRNLKEKFREE